MVICPYLEHNDPRCAVRLSLHRLDEALGQCADEPSECPLYQQKVLGYAAVSRPAPAEAPLAVAG